MRRLYLGLIPIALLIGCASTPVKDAMPSKAEEKPAEPVVQEPTTVQETVYLVKEEISYFGDGSVDQKRVNSYREDGTEILESVVYDAEGEMSERIEYTYDGDLLTEERSFDQQGDISSIHRYSYRDGLLVEDQLFNGEEELQTRLSWEYDNQGRRSRWEVYNGSGSLLAYTLYSYEGERLDIIENYNPAGDLEEFFLHEYEDGFLIKLSEYDNRERLQSYTSYRYKDGVMIEEAIHRTSGAVKRRIVYENGEHGEPETLIYLDPADNILEKIGRSYVTREVTRVIEE